MNEPKPLSLIPRPTSAFVNKQPRGTRQKIWPVAITQESAALARSALEGRLDALAWGRHEERARIMEALATARALLWQHERASYELEDCQHVAAVIAAGSPPSRIVLGLTGAFRDPYWRRRGIHFRDVRRNLEQWVALAKANMGKVVGSGDKGEAIERWRRAWSALPVGLRIGRDGAPDFTHMTTEQIDLEARGLEEETAASRARASARKLKGRP